MSEISFRAGRRRKRRLAKVGAWMLIAIGVLVLADAATTMLWQEPVSALIASLRQEGLRSELTRVQTESESPSLRERLALDRLHDQRLRVGYLAKRMALGAADGSAIGRIEIPAIKASFVLVKGTGTSELEEGPGVYSRSAYPGVSFPGEGGTTAIAGHRTTFLEPFRDINELRRGERIVLAMPYATLTYTIVAKRIVLPTDVEAAIRQVKGPPRLVLSACTPLFSAEKRLLVYARLTRTRPRGAALDVSTRPVSGMLAPFGDAAQALPTIGARSPRAQLDARRS